MEGLGFSPSELTVHPGDRVTWMNKDLFPHTVTAVDGTFDSKTVPANEQWTLVVSKTGTFPYSCTFHPVMKARLIVK